MKQVAVFACLVVGLLVVASPAGADPQNPQGRCSLAGTWIGDNDAGFVFLITITPLDRSHRSFSIVADADANHPSGGGVFSTAVELGTFHGEAARTGRRTFDQMALSYGRDDSFPFPWIGTVAVSGNWELSSDCDTAQVVWHAGAFFPEDDPFADEPFFCFPPITGTYRRVPIVPSACEP